MNKLLHKISRTRRIMLGFLAVILVGSLLLMLPFATREGQTTTYINALFTSVSATCVTGLVAYDSWTHWTWFGQLVLLIQIQIGGLGFITISSAMMIMLRKRIGISRRALIQDSLSTLQINGSVSLIRRVIIGTVFFEGVGAIILSTQFAKDFGVIQGIYYGVFHAVSAFCNAGFDLLGSFGEFSSFCPYYDNTVVIITLCALIVIGGLGFVIWEDLWENKYHWKKYRFQTKLVLWGTTILIVGATGFFFILERNGMFAMMNTKQKFLAALFSAVTPRTAGFNSIDTASLGDGSLFLTVILMFIGGSPGSTAGGIKTVTFFILLLEMKAYLLQEKDIVIFKRRIPEEAVTKAGTVFTVNLTFAIIGILLILSFQNLPIRDILFEVFSAVGTSGMSTGITRSLNNASRCVIMVLMFAGRMGSLTFAMSFTERDKISKIRYPADNVTLG